MTLSLSDLSRGLALNEGFDDSSPIPHVFCDMDEVLCDFYGTCMKIYGVTTPKEVGKKLDEPNAWDNPELFRVFSQLAPLPDAKTLMSELVKLRDAKKIRLSILTAIPAPWTRVQRQALGTQARADKKNWIARYFPAVKNVITCHRQEKAYYGLADHVATGIQPILIDDNKSNCQEWGTIAHGIAIMHTSAATSIRELHQALAK